MRTPTRILVISDIHLRARVAASGRSPHPISTDVDVCVVAGDVCDDIFTSLAWLEAVIPQSMPVIFVPGNHEYYGHDIDIAKSKAQSLARAKGILLLDDEEVVVHGVRFIGGTLWTDYRLATGADEGARIRTMMLARRSMSDHHHIRISTAETSREVMPSLFLPKDAAALHETTRAFILERLRQPHEGPTVVVTHHAPHPNSISEQWQGHPLNGAFASDMREMIVDHGPDLWIHGHVHTAFDYIAPHSRTRIVCNPRGYEWVPSEYGKNGFSWSKIVEV